MAVKDDLLEWVITNKNEVAGSYEGEEFYVTFRAAEAAADIGANLPNVNNALGVLKKEGFVRNPERGWWSWTGYYPEEEEKVEPKKVTRKREPKDPLEAAREMIRRSLESTKHQLDKVEHEIAKLEEALAKAKSTAMRLAADEVTLTGTLDSLGNQHGE